MCNEISWSALYKHRRAAQARFGKIFDLPIAKRVRDVLLAHVADGDSVLEVGAGDRSMGQMLQRHRSKVEYRSLDIDAALPHDYRDVRSIDRTFDCVFAFEVIEHLELAAIPPWLARLREVTRPQGCLLLSTPNTFYPPAYLRDATHRTPLCYDELAGLLAAAGWHVERIVRIYHDPLWRMIARRYLFGWLFRLIGIDFARQIVVVARTTAPLASLGGPPAFDTAGRAEK